MRRPWLQSWWRRGAACHTAHVKLGFKRSKSDDTWLDPLMAFSGGNFTGISSFQFRPCPILQSLEDRETQSNQSGWIMLDLKWWHTVPLGPRSLWVRSNFEDGCCAATKQPGEKGVGARDVGCWLARQRNDWGLRCFGRCFGRWFWNVLDIFSWIFLSYLKYIRTIHNHPSPLISFDTFLGCDHRIDLKAAIHSWPTLPGIVPPSDCNASTAAQELEVGFIPITTIYRNKGSINHQHMVGLLLASPHCYNDPTEQHLGNGWLNQSNSCGLILWNHARELNPLSFLARAAACNSLEQNAKGWHRQWSPVELVVGGWEGWDALQAGLRIYLSVRPSIYRSIDLSILSFFLSIYLSFFLSIYLSIPFLSYPI